MGTSVPSSDHLQDLLCVATIASATHASQAAEMGDKSKVAAWRFSPAAHVQAMGRSATDRVQVDVGQVGGLAAGMAAREDDGGGTFGGELRGDLRGQ